MNLDAIVFLHNELDVNRLLEIMMDYDPELVTQFLRAFSLGKAQEVTVSSSLVQILLQTFPHELVLGGQEGFFMQALAQIKSPKTIIVLHLPIHSSLLLQQIEEYYARDLYAFTEQGLSLLEDIERDDSKAPIHVVIEYPKDLRLKRYKGVRSPVSNRFIFSNDPINSSLKLDEFFIHQYETLVQKNWVFLLSGYHLLSPAKLTATFMNAHKSMFQKLQGKAKWVHFELADTVHSKVRSFIMKEILPFTTSIGLNEVELHKFLNRSLPKKVSLEYFLELLTSFPYEGIILFHTHGLYISVDSSSMFTRDEWEQAFRAASDHIVNTRSTFGTQTSQNTGLLNHKTFTKWSFNGKEGYAFTPHLLNPISSTVGLGDTISTTILYSLLHETN